MIRPSAIWQWDDSATGYVDLTDNVRENTSFTFLSETADEIYIGLERRFIGFLCDLSTNGSYTGMSIQYQAADSTWKKVSQIDSYEFNRSRYLRWVLPDDWIKFNFTDTVPHATSAPDTVERYWIKITATGITTAAVISMIRMIPYATYTTPQKVADMLMLTFRINPSSRPSDLLLEDLIRRAEDRIDYVTYKSWRFNAVSEEHSQDAMLQDYNRYGVFPRHRNIYKVYNLTIWDGARWHPMNMGRQSDYFVDYDRGIVYFTRLFLLPAAYGMVGRYFHWGFGEYKMSVRIDYAYGRDMERDSQFHIVEDITTRQAAIDLLRHHDYTRLIPSGTDKVPLERKIDLMQKDIDNKLEELKAVTMW